jgi:hypothetical protein
MDGRRAGIDVVLDVRGVRSAAADDGEQRRGDERAAQKT